MTIISLPHEALLSKANICFSSAIRNKVEALCQDIVTTGLLNPLIVIRENGRYVIMDGKKRFKAIRKLTRRNMLPRSLCNIPCILIDDATLPADNGPKPLLLSDQELVTGLIHAMNSGSTSCEAANKFQCSPAIVQQAQSLETLHPKLQDAFTSGAINLEQAAAFATLPNPKSQWDLLIQLGPFASDKDIIAAISKGETVIETKTGNVIILPSRAPVPCIMALADGMKMAA